MPIAKDFFNNAIFGFKARMCDDKFYYQMPDILKRTDTEGMQIFKRRVTNDEENQLIVKYNFLRLEDYRYTNT